MFSSYPFKICDPIHGFIRFEEIIQKIINSLPFQRLRYIHQMGAAFLVYPGATHTRFEHSLGVMELVTRIYNTLIAPHHLKVHLPDVDFDYWRLILRCAALCHDLGHLPFSHTAEKSLLPPGGHEKITIAMIRSPRLRPIWQELEARFGPHVEDDIIKLSVQEEELKELKTGLELNAWEKMLSQIITEDNFGADRIDYLVRDARYTGTGYGHFDYHQLIDCLRILPSLKKEGEFALGVSASGIQSVEALWIARYMMYARVYQHGKCRVFSNHLERFMTKFYKGKISTDLEDYLAEVDAVIIAELIHAAKRGDRDAACLLKMEPAFSELALEEREEKPLLPHLQQLKEAFQEKIFIDDQFQKNKNREFPVLMEEGRVLSSYQVSPFLRDIPLGGKALRLFVERASLPLVKEWIAKRI